MRISIDRADLAHALAAVTKTIEARNTAPILSNVLLEIAGDKLTITGTDLDIVASATIPAPFDSIEGAVTVPASMLDSIVKKASGNITLEATDNNVTVKSGRSRFNLQSLPAEDFPTFGDATYDLTIETDLAALLAPVAFAISKEETRFYLNGAYLHAPHGRLVAVATDGHRLAHHKGDNCEEFAGIILPRKLVSLVPRGVVKLEISTAKVRITAGETVLVSKLIDATYPEYQRVIPANNTHKMTIDRDALLKAVERVSVVSGERGRAVRFTLSDGALGLDMTSEGNAATEELPVENDTELTIGFNGQYVGDVLRNVDAGPVVFMLGDSGSPALVSGANDNWKAVLMPMRV